MVDRNEDSLNVLMDAYRVYQETQKHNEATTRVDLEVDPDDKSHQRLLVEAYHKHTCLTVSKVACLFLCKLPTWELVK